MATRFLSPAFSEEDVSALSTAKLNGVEVDIYNDLWNAVINRRLVAGIKLDEAAFCEIYGISRTIIRKVFHMMEQEGIVELRNNRGAYIASPTEDDAKQLLEALTVLLVHFAQKLASSGLSAPAIERLKLHLTAEAEANENHNFHSARRLRGEFCTLLGLLDGNRILAISIERYIIRWTLCLALYQDTPVPGSNDFCRRVADAILSHDGNEAVRIIQGQTYALSRSLHQSSRNEVDLRSILKGEREDDGDRHRPARRNVLS